MAAPAPTSVEVISAPLGARAWFLTALFGVGFSVILVWLAAVAHHLTPTEGFARLVDSKDDDRARAGARLLAGEVQRSDLVILGTSSARDALWQERVLEADLMRLGGQRLRIVNLASSAQSLAEASFLATYGKARPGQTVVVFIGFGSLQFPDGFARLQRGEFLIAPTAVWGDFVNDGLVAADWRSSLSRLMMHWHVARQFTQRVFRFGLNSWAQRRLYGVPDASYALYPLDDLPAGKKPDKQKSINRAGAALVKNFDANMASLPALLTRLATSVQGREGKLVVAMSPEVAPELRDRLPTQYARFQSELAAFSVRSGVEVVDWNPAIDWSDVDAVDASHLSAIGRKKWSGAFLTWLANNRGGA